MTDCLTPGLSTLRFGQQLSARRRRAALFLAASVAFASAAPRTLASDSAASETAKRLGWRPLSELDSEQQEQVPNQCCGIYVPPADLLVETPVEGGPTEYLESDLIEGNLQTRYRVSGNVRITQGGLRITADEADVDEVNNCATVSGNIRLYESGLLIVGDQAQINRETGATRIEGGEFVVYESRLRGSAGLISRDEQDVITLKDGMFTQCEPGAEHWALKGSSITIDPNKRHGVARDARVEIGGIPVFYWPYMPFPVGDERMSGFLFPSVSSEDIAVPYYINLAPNYDMTVTPRFVADRGAMVEAEFRHLSPRFETVLGGAWLPSGKDDITSRERRAIERGDMTAEAAAEFDGEDRWLASIQQVGGRGKNWFSRIDYTKVSDYAYFNHLDTTNLDVSRSTHLRQLGEIGYRFPNWTLSASAVEYQTIALDIAEPYQQKPVIRADGRYRWDDLTLNLNNEFTRFDHGDDFLDPFRPNPVQRPITGERLRLDYELSWNKQWLWGFFRPSALLKSVSYKLDEGALRPDAELEPSITVPQTALDFGLFFERDGRWFGSNYLQTFEPRVFYFYSDYRSHDDLYRITPDNRSVNFDSGELTFSYNQLFRTNRFSGGDRIEDANRVSVGLTSRFLSATGAERMSISLGQIYYLEDRRVTLNGIPQEENRSELAGQFTVQLTDSLRLGSDLLYNDRDSKVNRGNAYLRYMDDAHRIFNIGYRYDREAPRTIDGRLVDQDRSQGDVSVVWPLNDTWAFIARQHYDFTNERELDSIVGLEYNSCCYRIRVAGRRWLDNDLIDHISNPGEDMEYDRGIFFEFQLRGMGGMGSSNISSALSEGIYNFNRREEAILGRPVNR